MAGGLHFFGKDLSMLSRKGRSLRRSSGLSLMIFKASAANLLPMSWKHLIAAKIMALGSDSLASLKVCLL